MQTSVRSRVLALVIVAAGLASACDQSGHVGPSDAPEPWFSVCSRLEPIWGTAACPRLTREQCGAVNWTGSAASNVSQPACFGFFEDIGNCPTCNILSISDYTMCRNKQYIDCLLDGHLAERSGSLCFVTSPSEVQLTGSMRITAREVCYYRQQTGRVPPLCPAVCAVPERR